MYICGDGEVAVPKFIFIMPRVKLFNETEILNNAMELFWKNGYHATSIQDLVNHLGISRGSLYDTFEGKRNLFELAFEKYRTDNIQAVSSFMKSQASVKTGIRTLFERAIQESIEDKDQKGCFVINTITELIPGDEAIQTVINKNNNAFTKLFHTHLNRGERSGEIPSGKDLKTIAQLIFTLYNGIKVVAKVKPNRKKLMSSVDAALTLLD